MLIGSFVFFIISVVLIVVWLIDWLFYGERYGLPQDIVFFNKYLP